MLSHFTCFKFFDAEFDDLFQAGVIALPYGVHRHFFKKH